MPFITSPSILSTKNAANVTVVPVNRAIRFVGATVLQDGPAQTVVTIAAGTNTWNETGNTLTGVTPDAPVEFFGSLNDYDVKMIRNSVEILRLISSGVTLIDKNMIVLTVDPTAGAGVAAPIGSLGLRESSGIGQAWLKTGAADTDWGLLDNDGTDEWLLTGNTLTGATPDAPDQSFGSTNDYDVVQIRNNLERLRFTSVGISLNFDRYKFLFTTNSFQFGFGIADVASATGDGSLVFGEAPVFTPRGILSSNGASGSLVHGYVEVNSSIQTVGKASHAFGRAASSSSIQASGEASLAFGYAFTVANILASGAGSHASGQVNEFAAITASNIGAVATGKAFDNGTLIASGIAAHSHGSATNSSSTITASGEGSNAFGYAIGAGTIIASNTASHAFGYSNLGQITSSAEGSFAFGKAITSGIILGSGNASFASGSVSGVNSAITASGIGSSARGVADLAGKIIANNSGTFAHGSATDTNSQILSSGLGSTSFGVVTNGAQITASGDGAFAIGSANSGSGVLIASNDGAFVGGRSASGQILSSGAGSICYGFVSSTASMTSSSAGSICFGSAVGVNSQLISQSSGSFACGSADAGGTIRANTSAGTFAHGAVIAGEIRASGIGSYSFGYALTSGSIISTGSASYAGGYSESATDGILSSALAAFAYGQGLTNPSRLCTVFGRFSSITGTDAWVSTEPLFVLGNGASNAARNNAYQVDKDGKQTTTGSHVNKAIRLVAAASAISARTDRTIVFDTTGAGGNLTLPAGEDGLEFIFSPKGAGAALYTLVPDGADVFDVSVNSVLSSGMVQGIQYLGGTWYSITN